MSKTAIVILNWNGLEYLRRFLAVTIANSPVSTEIIVADNASTDGSSDWVRNNFPSLKLIQLEKNHGFAGGYNRALQQVEAEYFILLNSDIEVTSEWTEPLVSFMDKNPDVASCQPKILSWHNRNCFEYAGAAGGFIDKFGYPFCRGRIFDYVEKDSNQYNSPVKIFWSSGACMVIRSDIWKKCGGFDDDFFAHMEEIDLCWRIHKEGYKIYFIPESVVYHVGGGMLPYDSPFKTYLNFRNNLFLLYKNLPDRSLRYTLFVRKLLDGISAVRFLLQGKFANARSVWKAHRDYYKSLKTLKTKRNSGRSMVTGEFSDLILNKSLVFEFYLKRKKTFDELGMNII